MASLYVSYYAAVENDCASLPMKSEVVTTSGTSAQSTANTNGALVAMLFSDAAHYVTIGSNPTAAAGTSVYLPAGVPLWLRLAMGAKLAAITV